MNGGSEVWHDVPGYEGLYQANLKERLVRNARTRKILDYCRGEALRLSKNGLRRDYHVNAIMRAVENNKALLA